MARKRSEYELLRAKASRLRTLAAAVRKLMPDSKQFLDELGIIGDNLMIRAERIYLNNQLKKSGAALTRAQARVNLCRIRIQELQDTLEQVSHER